jgi:hypothetical protein
MYYLCYNVLTINQNTLRINFGIEYDIWVHNNLCMFNPKIKSKCLI